MNHLKNIAKLRFIRSLHTTKNKLQSAEPASTAAAPVKKKTGLELVPSKPVASKINLDLLPPRTVIDGKTIALLERLSLVDCVNEHEIKVLEDAIHFADQILLVNTAGVEPLITVLEDRPLETREDKVTEGNIRDAILLNASESEEDYLVSPIGNIPLDNPVSRGTQDNTVPGDVTVEPVIDVDNPVAEDTPAVEEESTDKFALPRWHPDLKK